MPRITVQGPDDFGERTLELPDAAELWVGRAPTPDPARSPFGAGSTAVRVLEVPAASVSANHLLAWTRGGEMYLSDPGSRNGTWLRLPPGETLRVGAANIVVQLARPLADGNAADEPPAPEWADVPEFGPAVAACVERWSSVRGLDAEVRVVEGDMNATSATWIPLASGEALVVSPRATAHSDWGPLLEKLWRWVAHQNSIFEAERRTRDEGMILTSPAIRAAHRRVVEAARSEARALLLMGPSGAGKEMLAEVFHRHSGRAGPFVAVNCAMFNKEFLRSELFGAEAGSFSGATKRIVGAVERAQGGTLFLDEIGELPVDVQPMLLRFLDRRTYEPLGHYGKPQLADVCVVAATNKDLRAAARDGTFREDLWYRLSVHVVSVPGLRDRWSDLVAYLAQARPAGSTGSLLAAFAPEAIDVLRAHAWEGNFRELANFRQRLLRRPGRAVDAPACRALLAEGSLRPEVPAATSVPASETDWAVLASHAVAAFTADHGHAPSSWDEQKEWNEKYLKPLLFHHLAGLGAEQQPPDDGSLASLASRAAARARADRGTAVKQLTRYFERFTR